MDWLLTRLNILAEGLEKKEQALSEIVNITENQSTVLQGGLPEAETQAFIVQMNYEKQLFIKQVIQCDNMFESVLKEAGPALDAAPESYKPQVLDLQKRIRRVMDLDVKIRVYEEKNNALMNGKQPSPMTVNEAEPRRQPDLRSAESAKTPPAVKTGIPAADAVAAQKMPPIQPDANRIINAYAKNTRNYTDKK